MRAGVHRQRWKIPFCSLSLTTGVAPKTVVFEEAKTTADYVKSTILGTAGFPNIDVAVWEGRGASLVLAPISAPSSTGSSPSSAIPSRPRSVLPKRPLASPTTRAPSPFTPAAATAATMSSL